MWRGLLLAELNWTSHGQNSQEQWLTAVPNGFQQGAHWACPGSQAAMQPEERWVARGRGCTDVDGPGTICMLDWRMPYKITLHNRGPIAAICHFVIWSCTLEGFFTHLTQQHQSVKYILCVHSWMNNCVPCSWATVYESLLLSSLSVLISNTDAEKDRGLLENDLVLLGWLDRVVAGKIPYYTEYKTWNLKNPPFISWWSWVELGPREWETGSNCQFCWPFWGLFWDHPSFLCIPDQQCIARPATTLCVWVIPYPQP